MSMGTGAVTDVLRIIQERGMIWAHQQFQLAHSELMSFPYGFRLQVCTIRMSS